MRFSVTAALLALQGVLSACSGGSPLCIVKPVVTVTDAKTGQPICHAAVVAVHSGMQAGNPVTLDPGVAIDSGTGGCPYDSSRLMDLTPYTLSVSATGYQTATVPNVTVWSGSCNAPPPPPQAIRVSLAPG